MDVFSLLKQEHDAIRKRMEASIDASDPSEKKRLFEDVRRNVAAHHKGEDIVLYSKTRKIESLKEGTLEALEEHHYIAIMLDETAAMDPTNERFGAKLAVLGEFLEHHFSDEEEEHFPSFAEEFDEETKAEMAETYQAERDMALEKGA